MSRLNPDNVNYGGLVEERRRAFLEAPLGGAKAFEHARAVLGEVEVLEPWADVDTGEDLEALVRQVRADPGLAPALTA